MQNCGESFQCCHYAPGRSQTPSAVAKTVLVQSTQCCRKAVRKAFSVVTKVGATTKRCRRAPQCWRPAVKKASRAAAKVPMLLQKKGWGGLQCCRKGPALLHSCEDSLQCWRNAPSGTDSLQWCGQPQCCRPAVKPLVLPQSAQGCCRTGRKPLVLL